MTQGYEFDLNTWTRRITTGSPKAQLWFDRGLAWTYGYNHEEAVFCYRRALDHDPACAMAWWGIAYASGPFYNRPWIRFTPDEVAATLPVCHEAAEKALTCWARGARYARNREVMVAGMRDLGFETLLKDRWLSPIIVTFFCPEDPKFDFNTFYESMKARGFIIYPGKLTVVDSFRVGCIGQMDENVMRQVVKAAASALSKMGVNDASPPQIALDERKKQAA